jgi:Phosphodiester glycosidase
MKARGNQSARIRQRGRRWLWASGIVVAVFCLMMATLAALPVLSPGLGASVADALRAVVGPGPVAEVESISFQLQDVANQVRYRLTGGQPQMTWTSAGQPEPTPTPRPDTSASGPDTSTPKLPKGQATTSTAVRAEQPTPVLSVIDAPPSIEGGWQAFGPSVAGSPAMARASVKPDQTRPYAQVALVRIDLSRTQLGVVPGTVEPVATKGVPSFPRLGDIPASDQAKLLAAFNGGFKAVHGGYGMMVDGITILPPKDDMATLAIYRDGSVRLGAWGRDITSTLDMVAYRQNCPLLVDAGQINPSVNDGSRKEWGYTVKNLDTTWRSGLGISRDGRFLIYAAGTSLTVESLGRALQEAGAYYAVQLDINGFYTRFVTYAPSDAANSKYPVKADKLLKEMSANPAQFLAPYDRDFFYITAAPHVNAIASTSGNTRDTLP